MAGNHTNVNNSPASLEYRKKKNAESMKHQITSFGLMFFLTILAFLVIAYPETFKPVFAVPFIILLAVVQCILQLYYFMHMSEKGHEGPALFLYSGIVVGLITILAFMTIVWN